MPFVPKMPEACRDLDHDLVRRTLTKHRLDICAAAKELGVERTALRRLTWHDPKLLDEAMEVCDLYVIKCNSRIIQGLYSPNRQRRERAVDQFFSSSMAYGSPMATALARAPKPRAKSNRPPSPFIVEMNRRAALKKAERARAIEAQAVTGFEESIVTAADDCLPSASMIEPETLLETPPPPLPVWLGPCPPPPLVAHLYAPYSPPPPPRPMIVGGPREAPRPAVLRRRLRRA
jgi:hypothetical protein